MEIAVSRKIERKLDGHHSPSNSILRWIALLLCFSLVWVFMFVIAPWIETFPMVKPLTEFIEESGIDASALYYTEVEEASEAELNMRSTMEYLPKGP
jgi:hypothetical protein